MRLAKNGPGLHEICRNDHDLDCTKITMACLRFKKNDHDLHEIHRKDHDLLHKIVKNNHDLHDEIFRNDHDLLHKIVKNDHDLHEICKNGVNAGVDLTHISTRGFASDSLSRK
jgi:hypothetical protein